MSAIHLHRDDCPATLDLLERIIGTGRPPGWEPTAEGAYVDWEQLLSSYLSSTEKAAVHIARGCSILEPAGGLPPRLEQIVRWAVEVAA